MFQKDFFGTNASITTASNAPRRPDALFVFMKRKPRQQKALVPFDTGAFGRHQVSLPEYLRGLDTVRWSALAAGLQVVA
jgi:hypothetical protein